MIRPLLLLALAVAVQPPQPPAPRPVTETLYGTKVTDPYRG